ncbi:MAG: FAD-binding protein [Planctomycetia bacterium]
MIAPTTLAELAAAVRSAPRVLAVGAETKPRLSAVEAVKISTRGLRGIVEYEPDEFTFTALAGTPLAEIVAALGERNQYLPFDPLFVAAGGTLGGAVAAGISGPGRFRYGGIRDFILGVRFVDGTGRLLRLGGKVVKNAAGFDVPKFLVGSLGRFGAIGEVTFKVFPRPEATLTLELPFSPDTLTRLARSRYEPDAIDVPPGGATLLVRLAGPARSIEALAREIGGRRVVGAIWERHRETPWRCVADVAPERMGEFRSAHVSCAGSLALSTTPLPHGLALRGDGPLWPGGRTRHAIEDAVKAAFDPDHRFPTLDD